ncbi:MAG TPA: PQQ-binding-like beta-propeller repeat protein [Candidatus Xenobia bacterium]
MRVRSFVLACLLWALPVHADAPHLLVQNGHHGPITAVVPSRDGRLVFTGGQDGTFKIWDAKTARVQGTEAVPTRPGNGEGVSTMALSPNGRLLAVATWSSVTLWDVSDPILPVQVDSLQPAKVPIDFGYNPIFVRFSGDSELLTGVGDEIRLWKLDQGHARLMKTLPGDAHAGLDISPDGQQVTSGDGGQVAVDEIQAQSEAQPRQSAPRDDRKKVTGGLMTYGPDGSLAAAAGQVQVFDKQGQLRYRIDKNAKFVAWSPDGHHLVTSTSDGTIDVIGTHDGHIDNEFQYGTERPSAVAFASDSQGVLVGYSDGTARSFGLDGRLRSQYVGHSVPLQSVAFLPGGEGLVTTTHQEVVLWNLATGRIRWTVARGESQSGPLAVYGHLIAVGDDEGEVELLEAPTGQILRKLAPPGRVFRLHVESLAFSPDGRRLAAGNASGYISVFDTKSGEVLVTYPPQDEFGVSSLAFAPDNRTLISGHFAGEVRQQDVPTKTVYLSRPIAEHYKGVSDVAVSPDGKTVVAAIDGGFLYAWPADRAADPRIVHLPGSPSALAFNRSGRLAVALQDGRVLQWDLKSPQAIDLVEHGGQAVSFSPDGRLLVTAGRDATLRFFDHGVERAQAVQMDGGHDWVVTDANGRFDGSSGGQRLMEWRIGDHVYGLEQFFNRYYTPALLAQALKPAEPLTDRRSAELTTNMATGMPAAKSAPAPPPPQYDITHLPPPPRVTILSPDSGDKVPSDIVVRARLTDEGGGTSRPVLFLNGHRLPGSGSLQGNVVTFHARLASGPNHLHLSASNRDGSIDSRGDDVEVTCQAPERRPVLYVLAVGIDHYQSGLSLSCAANDARSIAVFFKPGLFSAVKPVLLIDGQASKQGILQALHGLETATSPGDAVVIYLAGHGTVLGDLFYYLPYDVRKDSQESVRASGLSSVELGEALTHIPATKQVLVLDACHSGAAAGTLGRLLSTRDLPAETLAVARLAHDSGSFLIAASKGSQTAKEIPALRHGVLTYAILHGLGEGGKPAARPNRSGEVTVNALLQYVDDAVPALTRKYQGGDTQDVVQASSGQDFPIVSTVH